MSVYYIVQVKSIKVIFLILENKTKKRKEKKKRRYYAAGSIVSRGKRERSYTNITKKRHARALEGDLRKVKEFFFAPEVPVLGRMGADRGAECL